MFPETFGFLQQSTSSSVTSKLPRAVSAIGYPTLVAALAARHYIKKAYGARAAAKLVPRERNGRWFLAKVQPANGRATRV